MSPAFQVALAVGPLAAYFLMLGILQSTRRPTVVPGAIDFALLASALGGLVVFGPVGWVLTATLFPGPSLWCAIGPSQWLHPADPDLGPSIRTPIGGV